MKTATKAAKKTKSRAKPAKVVKENRAKANKKNIVKRSKYSEIATDKQGQSFIRSRFKFKFSKPQEMPVSNIVLRPEIFQGRTVPFAKETVDKILREGFETSQDPIVIWHDDQKKENIVISGHSRFEAAKRSKTLKKIPVKFFNGDKDEAIDYALIESNRSGKAEGVESDIKAYIRAKERGYNKDFLRSIFKEDSYISILDKLTKLNPQGRFIELLSKGDSNEAKSIPYLLRNAVWIGQLRKFYEKLTNAHEAELFNFLYKSDRGLKIKKEALYDLIKKKVENFNFDASKSLRLDKEKDFETIKESDPGLAKFRSMKAAIDNWNIERVKKEELWARQIKIKELSAAKKTEERIAEITRAIKAKLKEYIDFEDKLKKEDKRLQTSGLF